MREQTKYHSVFISLEEAKTIINQLVPFLNIRISFYSNKDDKCAGSASVNSIMLNTYYEGNTIGVLIHEIAHLTYWKITKKHSTNFYKEFWRLVRKYEELVENNSL